MKYQATFQRYELKYLLDERQKEAVLRAMEPYMKPDEYGRCTVRNLYFDTETYRLIRRSLEKPMYKEKLRLRSYCAAQPDSTVFVELKKKCGAVVYKRRLALAERRAMDCLCGGEPLISDTQIAREIDCFREYYERLAPTVFLSYEREAYHAVDSDFRVTFDENILYRHSDLSLRAETYGDGLLGRGQTLMELKTSGGVPLWMCHTLSRQGIFSASFSKYGCAYTDMLSHHSEGGRIYA